MDRHVWPSAIATHCSLLQCVAVCCSVSQCVAACRSVSQRVAVCRSVPFLSLSHTHTHTHTQVWAFAIGVDALYNKTIPGPNGAPAKQVELWVTTKDVGIANEAVVAAGNTAPNNPYCEHGKLKVNTLSFFWPSCILYFSLRFYLSLYLKGKP